MKKRLSFLLLLFLSASLAHEPFHLDSQVSYIKSFGSIKGLQDTRYEPTINGLSAGMLHCLKIPLTSWYVLHSFYINPLYRKRGYGGKLLQHVMHDIESKQNSYRVFIQPGPFEFEKGKLVTLNPEETRVRMDALINFYSRYGFTIAKPQPLLGLLRSIYYLMAIPENPEFFMTYYKSHASVDN